MGNGKGGPIRGQVNAREERPPKFQMSPRTHVTKSLIRSRKAMIEKVKAGDTKTAKLMGIVADTANLTDEEIGKLAPPISCTAKGIDIADIIDLRQRGLSHGAIGKVLGCTKKNVQKRLRGMMEEVDKVEGFKTYRGDVLAIHQNRILDTIDKGTIRKAGLKDRVVAVGVLFDKERQLLDKTGGKGKLQINIINYAGAAQTGKVSVVTVGENGEVTPAECVEEDDS